MASDLSHYKISQWNYRWTESYGSKDYSVENPEREGRDSVKVTKASVSVDGRSVLLKVPELQPVMQLQVRADLAAVDGHPLAVELYGTIHVVPR